MVLLALSLVCLLRLMPLALSPALYYRGTIGAPLYLNPLCFDVLNFKMLTFRSSPIRSKQRAKRSWLHTEITSILHYVPSVPLVSGLGHRQGMEISRSSPYDSNLQTSKDTFTVLDSGAEQTN